MSPPGDRAARLAGSAARVSRRWPRVPFWLQRGAAGESGAALPGAAVSATALIAALVYEPSQAWPIFRSAAPEFLGHPAWLALFSLAAPLATLLILGSRRPGAPGGRWLAILPVHGLFAVARAVTEAEAAGGGRRPAAPLPAAEWREPPGRRLLLPALAAFGPYRAGLPWQALLFASHLGWLGGAAAWLGSGAAPAASRIGGFAALHLLALAGALLMMEHERRRRALLPAGWANRLAPWLLLLPAPANLLAAGCWLLPRSRQAARSLAAFTFAAQGPLQRLAAFRTLLPARSGLSPFFASWSAGDPFAHVAAARRRREQPWIALHRLALVFQAAAAVRLLMLLAPAESWVLRFSSLALAGAGLMVVLEAALLLGGFTANAAILLRLGRASGISFALGFGLAAGLVSAAPPGEAVGLWVVMLLASAVAMLLRLPAEILGASEKLESLPPSVRRGMAFGAAAIGLQLLLQGYSHAVASAFEWTLAASPLFSPLLVYLAARSSAPPLARSRRLSFPGSAVLLPFYRGRL